MPKKAMRHQPSEAALRSSLQRLLDSGVSLAKACKTLDIPYQRGRRALGQRGTSRSARAERSAFPADRPTITDGLAGGLREFFVASFLHGRDFPETWAEMRRVAEVIWRSATMDPKVLTLAANSGIQHFSIERRFPEVEADLTGYLDEEAP